MVVFSLKSRRKTIFVPTLVACLCSFRRDVYWRHFWLAITGAGRHVSSHCQVLDLATTFDITEEKIQNFHIMARNSNNLDRIENDVNEVTHLMKNNIEKVIDRGDRLDDLQDRSEELLHSSVTFHKSSKSLKRKMCCQNAKMTCCIIVIITVIIIGVILVILLTVKPWETSSDSGSHHNGTLLAP